MFSSFFSESPLNFRFVVSSLAKNRVSLLGSDKELVRMSFSIVADAGTSIDLSVLFVHVLENELVGRGAEITHIPPNYSAIS